MPRIDLNDIMGSLNKQQEAKFAKQIAEFVNFYNEKANTDEVAGDTQTKLDEIKANLEKIKNSGSRPIDGLVKSLEINLEDFTKVSKNESMARRASEVYKAGVNASVKAGAKAGVAAGVAAGAAASAASSVLRRASAASSFKESFKLGSGELGKKFSSDKTDKTTSTAASDEFSGMNMPPPPPPVSQKRPPDLPPNKPKPNTSSMHDTKAAKPLSPPPIPKRPVQNGPPLPPRDHPKQPRPRGPSV